ncbi:MAG: sensor histidine kinase, partial [Myxococcota bacterium]|nr:sensor histidine kinase [Myxococcota bacterium]
PGSAVSGIMKVPAFWNGLADPVTPGAELGSDGYMTLLLRVLLPSDLDVGDLALASRGANSSTELFVVSQNGVQSVLRHGRVGKTMEDSIPDWSIQYGRFSPPEDGVVHLVWHVSNHYHHYGGTWRMPTLGIADVIRSRHERDKYLLSAMLGVFLMMGLYHLGLFAQRRRRDSTLWFSLLCFCLALAIASFNYFFFFTGWEASVGKFVIIVKLLLLTPLFAGALTILYFASAIPSPWFSRYAVIACSLYILMGLPVVFEAPDNLAVSVFPTLVVGGALAVPLLWHLLVAIAANDRDARLLLLAVGSVAIGATLDSLATFGISWVNFTAMSGVGMVVFVLVQSYLLASRFTDALTTSELLTNDLQGEVHARTYELELKSLEALEASQDAQEARVAADSLRHKAEAQAHELAVALAELKQAQEKLVLQARMAALGTVAAGVAHEVRNPLTLTMGGVDDLAERLEAIRGSLDSVELPKAVKVDIREELDTAEQLAKLIERGSERIEGIVDNLSDFVDSGTQPGKQKCSLQGAVDTVISLLARPIHEKRLTLTNKVEESVWVMMNNTELNQVLMNILLNACQALPVDGRVEVASEMEGPCVMVRISDDGPGVDVSIRDHIFDPFFTTREQGEGTGLGLSISHSIMTNSGGGLHLESSLESGAEFVLTFPLPPEDSDG